MNSENSKTSKPHASILKLNNKLNLRMSEKHYQILVYITHGKI